MAGMGKNGQMVENTSILVGVCERVWVLELQQVLWTSNSLVVAFDCLALIFLISL